MQKEKLEVMEHPQTISAEQEGLQAKPHVNCTGGKDFTKRIGICPECGHSVFAMANVFACLKAINGNCSFIIDREYLEGMLMSDSNEAMSTLLEERTFRYSNHEAGRDQDVYNEVKLVHSEINGWDVELGEW